ncbi:WD40 repeat-like protein, partial [Aureobasidium melanogenum]
MSGIDLSLPDSVPAMARYQDRPMTLDSFAIYNLLDPHNEPAGLVEKCNSECPRDDYVHFRASPGINSLKDLIGYHLSTTVQESFDPNFFLVVTDPDWEQKGVCVVTLADEEGNPDKFTIKTGESGLLLVNLQIANTDWYEAKESAEFDSDDGTQDPESVPQKTFPDGASRKKPGTGFYIAFYAVPGIDPSQLIRDVEPFHDGKAPEDRVCRFEGFLKPDRDLVSQALDLWHPQACMSNTHLSVSGREILLVYILIEIFDCLIYSSIMAPATLIKSLENHDSKVRQIVFSPDSSLSAVPLSNGGCINIYRTATGVLQASTIEHENMIWDVSFSPSGEHILSACDDGIARLFNTTTGALEKEFHDDSEGWSDQRMFVACFTPDGKAIATGTDIVQIWDLGTGGSGPMDNVLRDETTISSIDFSPGKRFMVSVGFGGWGDQLRIWDMQTWEMTFESQENGVVFAVDGNTFAIAENEEVKLWDTKTMSLLHTLQGTCPVFSPDGNIIATSSRSHTIHLWDIETALLLQGFKPQALQVRHATTWKDNLCQSQFPIFSRLT